MTLPEAPLRRIRRTARLITAGLVAAALLSGCGSGTAAGPASPADDAAADPGLAAELPADIRERGTVRVATDVPFPPFEMFESPGSQQITGFDYDLGQALGSRLGVRFEFSQQKFDGLIPALQADQYDLILSAMTSNAERQKVIDFVEYFQSGSGILVAKGNPEGVSGLLDLCGKTVALLSGAQQVDFVAAQQSSCRNEGRPEIATSVLPKFSDAQLALSSGRAQAIVSDQPTLAHAAKTVGDGEVFEVVDDTANPGGYESQPGGIGVAKDDAELREAVRGALQQLIDDGTYAELLRKYGLEGIAVEQASVVADS